MFLRANVDPWDEPHIQRAEGSTPYGDRPYFGPRLRPARGGTALSVQTNTLIEKIQALPAERIAEVEDFVDFIRLREEERTLTRAAAAMSAPSFARIWSNPDDDAYDAL
jgi:hypothetical protein